jgi:hypothetical protein
VATGKTVTSWAKKNQIPLRTAYEWHRRPTFKTTVDRYRRRYLDRALGRLARNAAKAAGVVSQLASGADSQGVKLQAARAVLDDLMRVWRFAELEGRVTELERRDRDRSDDPGSAA